MKDPYRESTSPGAVGPFYRAPWHKRHRRWIFRGTAFATWATIDGLLWYWAFLFSKTHGGDYGFVGLLIIIHMIAAIIGSVVLFQLADREP
jgi:hypothetical protein